MVQVGSQLLGCLWDQLVNFLKEHKDIFAWSLEDMPGIDLAIIAHRLNVDPTHKSVIQKCHRFNPEHYIAIDEKVEKLLTANFIREVYYPEWLPNVVMVKNPTENGGSTSTTQILTKHVQRTSS